MRYGSIPRSIVRSLPAGPIDYRHTPDGLTEQAIDALLDELGLMMPVPDLPAHVVELSTDRRRNRQRLREVVRSLSATEHQPADDAGRWSA